jgi:hypothetical protein
MFVEETHSGNKLRQERHVCNLISGFGFIPGVLFHAAPDGAWMMFAGLFYKHGAPTELAFPSLIPLNTAKNR